jgi:hypothetical protein
MTVLADSARPRMQAGAGRPVVQGLRRPAGSRRVARPVSMRTPRPSGRSVRWPTRSTAAPIGHGRAAGEVQFQSDLSARGRCRPGLDLSVPLRDQPRPGRVDVREPPVGFALAADARVPVRRDGAAAGGIRERLAVTHRCFLLPPPIHHAPCHHPPAEDENQQQDDDGRPDNDHDCIGALGVLVIHVTTLVSMSVIILSRSAIMAWHVASTPEGGFAVSTEPPRRTCSASG